MDRKYQMTRLRKGDYLLPSNDGGTLWRLATYEEDGGAENWQGRTITGTYWALWKWDGGFPTGDQLAASIEANDWTRWQFWAGPLSSRQSAIVEALQVEEVATQRER